MAHIILSSTSILLLFKIVSCLATLPKPGFAREKMNRLTQKVIITRIKTRMLRISVRPTSIYPGMVTLVKNLRANFLGTSTVLRPRASPKMKPLRTRSQGAKSRQRNRQRTKSIQTKRLTMRRQRSKQMMVKMKPILLKAMKKYSNYSVS